MRLEFVKLKSCLLLLSVISILSLESLGGQRGFFAAWFGASSTSAVGDPYELLNPTAYWYPSVDINRTDRILGLAPINTADLPSIDSNGFFFQGPQYLEFGYPPELEIGTSLRYTLAAWVRATDNFGYMGIIGKSVSTSGNDRWHLRQFSSQHSGIVSEDTSGELRNLTSAYDIMINNWYHLVFVIDRTKVNGVVLYRDGVVVQTSTWINSNPITYDGGNGPFRIGSYGDSLGNPASGWKGHIDQAAVWKGRALTAEEVSNLFEETRSGRK